MSVDFEDEPERRILGWESEAVFDRLADISANPEPSDDDDWRCKASSFAVGGEDLDFVPDAYFYFVDGLFLVWGAYWIDRTDESNAIIAWIDRIPEPISRPGDF